MIEITIENLSKSYQQGRRAIPVLKDICLRIEPGEFFFLLGPSGCGKTTLLRILAGLLEPTAGRILFGDRDVTRLPAEKRNCAMVFQNYALWPHMTVHQNVAFGPQMKAVEASERKRIVEEKLDLVRMADYGLRKPNQLSGGQQQRIALARALAASPQCLLLDEPLSNLDARLRARMRVELRKLVKSMNTTALYVTHDQKEALSMADRIAVLRGGQIVQIGPPEEVYAMPKNEFVADFIGEANFISGKLIGTSPAKVRTASVGELISDAKHTKKVGDTVTCCVRPEKIRLHPTGSGKIPEYNSFHVTIREVMFFGDLCQVEIRLSGDLTWKVSAFSAAAAAILPGQTMMCSVDPASVIVLS